MKKIYLQPVTEYVDMEVENDMLVISLADEGGEIGLPTTELDSEIPAEVRMMFDFMQ